MIRRLFAGILAVSMLSLTACGGGSAETTAADSEESKAAGSTRTVKIICPYGVGGTADVIARKYAEVATELHPEYNFIVEQRTGGDGFAAATAFTEEKEDTTDLLIFGYGVAYRHDLGKKYQTEVVDFDRAKIKPLASIDDRTWILYAKPDVTLKDILEKSKTEGIKMSGGNPLSDPHLALGSLIAQEGGTVMVVPYDGGAAQKKGLADGEVDVFVGTTQAAKEDVEAGSLVPILAFSDKEFIGFVGPSGEIKVPTVAGDTKSTVLDAGKDYTGSILAAGGFIATRTGASDEWCKSMEQVAKDVWASDDYSSFISSIMLNKVELYGDAASAHLEEACTKAIQAFETLSSKQAVPAAK